MAVISSIQIDTSKAKKSIAQLEKELQECTEQLKNVELGSEAFYKLQKKAADAKGQIDTFNQTTDTLSKGMQGWGEQGAKAIAGISSGITAATALMQLFGSENEDVIKGIARLQQLMVFTQAIAGVKDLIESFKILKGVISTLNTTMGKGVLGAVILALSTIAAGWLAIKNKTNEAKKEAEEYQQVLETAAGTIEKFKNEDLLAQLPDDVKKKYTEAKKRVTEINEQIEIMHAEWKKYFEKGDRQNMNAAAYQLNDLRNYVKEYQEYIDKVDKALPGYIKAQEDAAKAVEKRKEDELTVLRAETEDYLNPFKDTKKNKTEAINPGDAPTDDEDMSEEEKRIEKLKTLLAEYKELKNRLFPQTEQQQLQEQYKADLDLLASTYENKLITEEEYLKRKYELQQYYKQKEDALIEASQLVQMQDAAQTLTNISSIFSSIASAMDEADEKQRKAMLAFQAASIVTSTISGAIMAYTGAASNEGLNGIPVVGPAIAQATGITNMIAVIASGAAQLANLRSKGNSDSATLSGVSAAVATNTLTTPTQYSSAIEGANIEESITDTKVYVVESDIQQTANKVSVQESENRY